MAKFQSNRPISQADPTIAVDVTPADSLPLGANRFQLVVVDSAGNELAPTVLDVVVRDTAKPTAVLDLVDFDRRTHRSRRPVRPVVHAIRSPLG